MLLGRRLQFKVGTDTSYVDLENQESGVASEVIKAESPVETVKSDARASAETEAFPPVDLELVRLRLRRRALDAYHHRPRRLSVAVNGIPLGSLDICNKKNELKVTTKIDEPLSFIEVFSEQNIRLAMLNADATDGVRIERNVRISLSDKRKLRVSFKQRAADLTISLTYSDPELEGWEIFEAMGLCCAYVPA